MRTRVHGTAFHRPTCWTTRHFCCFLTMLSIGALFLLVARTDCLAQDQSGERRTYANIHEAFQQIGERVPSFSGMFVDEDKDTLYVYLVPGRPGEAAEADVAISEVFGSHRPTQRRLQVLEGQYTFLELRDWYHHMMPRVLPLEGVVMTGIDDRANRLKVGIESSEAASAVEGELAALGIPRAAVKIEQIREAKAEGSLSDKDRPPAGGFQIQDNMPPEGRTGECTLGFIAIHGVDRGMVTASHCGNRAFRLTDTIFSQPRNGNGNRIAIETINPPLLRELECGRGADEIVCPGDRPCRCSDSLFATFDREIRGDLGYIARPDLNKTTWSTAGVPLFKITSKRGDYVVGQSITKIGAETGRRQGKITAACTDDKFSDYGTPRYILCVNEADYTSGGGDSGGPVFVITNSDKNEISLTGIHTGVVVYNNGNVRAIYSTIDQIQVGASELGTLLVCAPPNKC